MRTALLFLSLAVAHVAAQDLQLGVIYTCSGDRLYLESCNIRDLSDTATCQVAHPDRPKHNGFMAYTSETRGALKKLLPTCTQPSSAEVAKAQAHYKKQNDIQAANEKKANDEVDAIEARARSLPGQKPQKPEERAITRCITSGRLPASCTGNALLGAFGQMLAGVLPSDGAKPAPSAGPNMAGVFEGAGNWRLDFTDGGVLVNCAFLSPDERSYKLEFTNNRTAIVIDIAPKPLVLTLRADGTISGPGPVTIKGVVASGYTGGNGNSFSGYKDQNGNAISDGQAASGSGPVVDPSGNRVYGPVNTPSAHTNFSSRTATCPAQNLSSKGASVGLQTMQTDFLKGMFGGDKGPPTPPGIRMHGIFAAASTGFSVQFFPESAVLGCGPDVARAYPYNVVADGTKAIIHIGAPDHPLMLAFKPDGSLDPGGSGPYQVHGRTITGQNDNDDFTFAPRDQSCNLATLTASDAIPSSGGMPITGAGAPGVIISTATAPLGNATLSISSGFAPQPGTPNPMAGRPYVLLRDSYANALAKGGVSVPPGMSPYKYVGSACGTRTPDCQKIVDAIKADTVSAVRADANGSAILPGVAPGNYYLMISTRYNNQSLIWGQAVPLKAGANSFTLDQRNATPLN